MAVIKKSPKTATEVAVFLKRGGVVICPTDTVYGFLADATNSKAVEKIYRIKRRSKTKPLPIFVANFSMAEQLSTISASQKKIIKKHWPGKYTFVLTRKSGKKLYGVDKMTIALRIPRYNFLNAILKKFAGPIAQTSVNISNETTLSRIDDIIKEFNSKNLLIVDGGNIKNNKSSKIFDLTHVKTKRTR